MASFSYERGFYAERRTERAFFDKKAGTEFFFGYSARPRRGVAAARRRSRRRAGSRGAMSDSQLTSIARLEDRLASLKERL